MQVTVIPSAFRHGAGQTGDQNGGLLAGARGDAMLSRFAKLSHYPEFLLLIALIGNIAFYVSIISASA
jgi:hypothetical protein